MRAFRPPLPDLSRPRIAARSGSVALALVAFLAACAPQNLPPLPAGAPGAYRLGPGDEVRVTVFEEPRLSGGFRVSDTGTISLPLLGVMRAAGITATALREQLDGEIRRRGLLPEPRTAVEVAAYRPVFVLGEVERAGAFPWQPGLTTLGAVALAGGFSPRAVRDRVTVQRAPDGAAPQEYAATRDSALEPGDVVTVLERRF